jgi:thioredoxin-like negative regulator of GroEL
MSYEAYKAKVGPARLALFTGRGCAPCAQLKPVLTKECEQAGVELAVFDIADEIPAVRSLGLRAVPTLVVINPAGDATVVSTGSMPLAAVQATVAGVAAWA